MADDPKAAAVSDKVGDAASLSFGSRTTHPIAVKILKVEGYGSDSADPPHTVSPHSDPQGRPVMVSAPVSAPARKKTSSFQITSVTMGSRHSNDGGDDSADDLDESHTEDLSSDVLDVSKTTDYEYSSEDAFSSIKDDVATIYQPSGAQGRNNISAPPPPAVSVFQSAAATGASNTAATGNVSVTVVEAPNVPMSVVQNPDIQWQNRFRVVKIQTGEPFRRGRWVCMDFLDPPPPSSAQCDAADKESGTGGTGSGNSSGTSSVQHGESVVLETSTSQNVVTSSWSVEPNTAMTSTGNTNVNAGYAGHCDQYPVSILLQTQQQGNLDFTNTALHMQVRTTQIQSHQPVAAMQPLTVGMIPSLGASNIPIGVQQSEFVHQAQPAPSLHHQQQQQQPLASQVPQSVEYAHPTAASLGHVAPASVATVPPQSVGVDFRGVGASLPAAVSDFAPTMQTQPPPQQVEYIHSVAPSLQPPPLTQSEVHQPVPQMAPQQVVPPAQQASSSVDQYVPPAPQSHVYLPPAGTSVEYANPQFTQTGTTLQPTTAAVPLLSQGIPANSQPMSAAPAEQQQQQSYITQQQQQLASGGAQAIPSAGHPLNGTSAAQDPASQAIQDGGGVSSAAAGAAHGTASSANALTSMQQAPTTSLEAGAASESGAGPTGEEGDPESASGASTVAIDNKIEQAMDLVKSHLMFAVREEVDVLKEKITELMDRINQLEYENSILKANATQETLAKLSWPPNPSST